MSGKKLSTSIQRSGFTLVELMVAITIIAILMALTVAAVMAFLRKGPDVLNRTELSELAVAVERFKTDWGFYPPDTIRLCSNRSQYGISDLDKKSLSILGLMYNPLPPNFTNIQWAGPGTSTSLDVTLEGDQALVFFLGGPPDGANPPGLLGGWSTNATDRVDVLNKADRKKGYTFDAKRLKLAPRGTNTAAALFPSYIDAYGKMPYVYFSSKNGYGPANTLGVAPYKQGAKYVNPDTFQIISAGADFTYGPGGVWDPATVPEPGKDDMANFYDKPLGRQ